MPKPQLKILGTILILSTLIASSASKNQESDPALAKRSLLAREKELFKTKPMSADLKHFIDRHRRKSPGKKSGRKKRSQGLDENSLYVIQNGQLIPFKSMKGLKRNEDNKKPETQGFTVVPLVIPINVKAPENKLVKIRTLDEQLREMQQQQEGKEDKGGPPVTPQSSSTLVTLAQLDKGETKAKSVEGDDTAETVEGGEEGAGNTTEETQVLHKILDDVQGLLLSRKDGNKKEGVICNLNGSWVSDAAGMRFDVTYQNSTRKKFRIHVADRIPPNEDGFLCDGNWTVFGEIPFKHSGMVLALAVHERDKHIATFIGECRVCEGSETVAGTWLLARSSRDCKDQKASHKILSDVWRREQGHTLRKKHLQEIGMKASEED